MSLSCLAIIFFFSFTVSLTLMWPCISPPPLLLMYLCESKWLSGDEVHDMSKLLRRKDGNIYPVLTALRYFFPMLYVNGHIFLSTGTGFSSLYHWDMVFFDDWEFRCIRWIPLWFYRNVYYQYLSYKLIVLKSWI